MQDKSARAKTFILFGILGSAAGITIYILLPTALFTKNIALVLKILLSLLVGMIFGLALLTVNLRYIIEVTLVYVFCFWEKKSQRMLLKQNLVAHKSSNKLTSIIFALLIGLIIFTKIFVSTLSNLEQLSDFRTEADIIIRINKGGYENTTYVNVLDPILIEHSSNIENFASCTKLMSKMDKIT